MPNPIVTALSLVSLTFLTGCLNTNKAVVAPTQALHSPNRRLGLRVTAGAKLEYGLSYDGVPLIAPSELGMEFEGVPAIGPDSEITKAKVTSEDSNWETRLYKRERVRDHYNQLELTLRQKASPERTFQVIFRLYDDGLAFRYALPEAVGKGPVTVTRELTQFTFATDAKCYAGSQLSGYAGAQEWEFLPGHLAGLPTTRPTGLPLLVTTPRAAVAVTESDLLDYPGLWLSPSKDVPPLPPAGTKMGGASVKLPDPPKGPLTGKPVTLYAQPAPLLDAEGNRRGGIAKFDLPHSSPWRVVMVAPDAGKLIESDLVMNLATPSKVGDASWVKPGITAWDNWWHGGTKMDTATLKQYIQLAADMGWPYQLVDWWWYGKPNTPEADITKVNPAVDMPELLRFAKERNVRLLLWLHSSDAARNDAYKKAFGSYEDWGIAGVKIDFMDRDDQDVVNWYESVAKEAAAHHLLLNFHGAYKSTGMNRTYPNQITREGILGDEYNRWSKRVTPEHRLTLPFTRFLAGPGDYTPGGFVNRTPAAFKADGKNTQVQATRCGELALFVLYDSPLTCACDHPDNYANQAGVEFLKIVPTVWKETRALQAGVGEYLVEARQAHNGDVFLGAATNSEARTLTVPLSSFLPNGEHVMKLWEDAADADKDATHVEVSERIVTNKDTITLKLAPAGGAVAQFRRH